MKLAKEVLDRNSETSSEKNQCVNYDDKYFFRFDLSLVRLLDFSLHTEKNPELKHICKISINLRKF